MNRYSIKMRASNKEEGHISGAEKIIPEEELEQYCARLLTRALRHSKGKPDFINLKIEAVREEEILHLPALKVTTIATSSPEEGMEVVLDYLRRLGLERAEEILALWKQSYCMRGAMLLDADTLRRLEPDRDRGIRATYMDMETEDAERQSACGGKNHFNEALVLATKVVNHPNILAELCISDDPDYVTGYIASREFGYVRITTLKGLGSPLGGRIFLFRGTDGERDDCIRYLQQQKVLVHVGDKASTPAAHSRVSHESGKLYERKGTKPVDKWKRMEEELQALREQHLYREIKVIESPQRAHVRYRGRDMLMLASNSYLDLCDEAQVKAYAAKVLMEYGTGSGGSRLTTGTGICHTQLEDALARFKGREAAIVFNTGFAANSGVIPCLCREGDVIYSDEKNHASIIDGCRQSRAETVVYRHNDMADLERKIRERQGRQGLIVSDGVFSMDGDIVNLPGLVELADAYGLLSMIDEAHATGVIGDTGRGCEEHFHMEGQVDILMGTLSKAIGAEGGYVCGSRTLTEYLKNKARSYIFSTSLSPVTMAAAKRALELIEKEPWRVERLQENISHFCGQLREHGVEADSETAIIPIRIGEEEKAVKVSARLMEQGFFIPAIRYPTVKKGEAMLRAALMATHTKEELAAAAAAIAEAIDYCGGC